MRQILFRGKKIDNGEWTYGFYFEHSIEGQKKSYIKYQTFDEGFVTNEVDVENECNHTPNKSTIIANLAILWIS